MNNQRLTLFTHVSTTCSAGRSLLSPAVFSFSPVQTPRNSAVFSFGTTCSAGRGLRSPAAFSCSSGQTPHNSVPFARKKPQLSRSKEGGANAV